MWHLSDSGHLNVTSVPCPRVLSLSSVLGTPSWPRDCSKKPQNNPGSAWMGSGDHRERSSWWGHKAPSNSPRLGKETSVNLKMLMICCNNPHSLPNPTLQEDGIILRAAQKDTSITPEMGESISQLSWALLLRLLLLMRPFCSNLDCECWCYCNGTNNDLSKSSKPF